MNREVKFDLDDISIVPSEITEIVSRGTISPYDENGYLPIITAPMDTVVNGENSILFDKQKVITCLPRGEKRLLKNTFESYSLNQFIDVFMGDNKKELIEIEYVLIDTANGHIKDLLDISKLAKEYYGDKLILMVGNIANPSTYRLLSDVGVDYVRVSIGGGNGCLTAQQLGVYYPMGSLIEECYNISLSLDKPAKIIADGGMKKYSDIIKCLALGADYVMVGSLLNKCLESAGDTYMIDSLGEYSKLNNDSVGYCIENDIQLYKKFRGMSTKEVQKDWGNTKLKTSEGIVEYRKVEYTLNGWVENMVDYLRSAMSYTNCSNLKDFIGGVEYIHITQNAHNRFKK